MKIARSYLAWTFGITWLSWGSLIIMTRCRLVAYGDVAFMIPFVLGGLAPTLAAFIALRKDRRIVPREDQHAVLREDRCAATPGASPANTRRALKIRLFKYRINVGWYAAIAATPLVISAIAWIINKWVTGSAAPFLAKPLYMAYFILPMMIVGGGLEEIGWRGVLLPELLRKTSPLKATGIVSLVWGVWHLPLWLIPGVAQYGSNFAWFMVNILSVSLLMTLLYGATGSLLACILFHALGNAYATIGISAWSIMPVSRLIYAATSLAIPIFLFWIFLRRKAEIKGIITQKFSIFNTDD